MLIITIIVSFIISVLSGLGVGGGGLFVIYLALFTNTPQLTVQGINLAFFLLSSSASLSIHLLKRKIYFLTNLVISFFGIVGSVAGTYMSNFIEENILRKCFGIMLVLTGALSFIKALRSKEK